MLNELIKNNFKGRGPLPCLKRTVSRDGSPYLTWLLKSGVTRATSVFIFIFWGSSDLNWNKYIFSGLMRTHDWLAGVFLKKGGVVLPSMSNYFYLELAYTMPMPILQGGKGQCRNQWTLRIRDILVRIRVSAIWLMDPDPPIFVTDLQDANKKLFFFSKFFCLLLSDCTFASFFKGKKS